MRKLKITKEDAVVFESDHIGCVNVSLGNTGFDPFIYVWNHQYPLGKEEAISNAQLIADAFNTANKCDMLPSELLELLINVYCSINQYGNISDSQKEILEKLYYNE